MATYSTTKTALDEISKRIQQGQKRLQNTQAGPTAVKNDLAQLETQYSSLITETEANATDNPDDPAWQNAKAEKDLLVAEFNALKTTATDMESDLNGYDV